KEIHVLEARVALVDVVQDEVGLAVEQALPGSRERLEMQMQSGVWAAVEEAAQQRQVFRQRAQVADHHAQLALLAHGELGRMRLERGQLGQEDPRALME